MSIANLAALMWLIGLFPPHLHAADELSAFLGAQKGVVSSYTLTPPPEASNTSTLASFRSAILSALGECVGWACSALEGQSGE